MQIETQKAIWSTKQYLQNSIWSVMQRHKALYGRPCSQLFVNVKSNVFGCSMLLLAGVYRVTAEPSLHVR